MKAVIHYSGAYQDFIIIESNSVEGLKELAFAEINKRGWEDEKCWSEIISGESRRSLRHRMDRVTRAI